MSRLHTAEEAVERLRPKLLAMIEHHRGVIGCKMKAVKKVARTVGTSEQWVRRVTGGYGKVKVQAHQFFNVLKEHVRLRRTKRKLAHSWMLKPRSSEAALSEIQA